VRRAEGAGLDGECAARVTIIVAATYKRFLFGKLFLSSICVGSLSMRFDMIRGELASEARNRATALYSVDP